VSSNENQNEEAELGGDFQQAFASYQQEFKAALERSAEALHSAIASAQQSMTEQLNAGFPPPLKLAGAPDPEGKPVAGQPFGPAVAQPGAVFPQIELPAPAPVLQVPITNSAASLPGTNAPSLNMPDDLAAAGDRLMSQAVESLNAAMKSAIEVMLSRPKGPDDK
jgi:hypothetical protein